MAENNLPNDYEKLAQWFPAIRRAMKVLTIGNQQIVTITVICDRYCKPVWWSEPQWSQLEPRSRLMKWEDAN